MDRYYDQISELGGVAMILLNHRDEATRHVTELADRFGATVHAHHAEVGPAARRGVVSIEALAGDTTLGPDLVALHTPGHTPGVTSYLWHNPDDGLRYLFTGDTLNQSTIDDVTVPLVFHPYEGNLHDYRRSLHRFRDTDSDVVVPGLGIGSLDAYRWSARQRVELFDRLLAELDQAHPVTDRDAPQASGA